MEKLFTQLLDNNFSELTGLTIDASIPLPEALINELVQSELRGNKNITSCHVTVHSENRIVMDLRTPMWPWPLNLKLKLFSAVDLTQSPKVRAFLENNVLLGKLGGWFKVLPLGITLYNNQISVDLDRFLPPGYKKFLPLVKSVEIRTEENKLLLDVKIKR
jgi:hypothetical protein